MNYKFNSIRLKKQNFNFLKFVHNNKILKWCNWILQKFDSNPFFVCQESEPLDNFTCSTI